jgi:hypothetical protein
MVGWTRAYPQRRHVKRAIVSFLLPKTVLGGYEERRYSNPRLGGREALREYRVDLCVGQTLGFREDPESKRQK